MHLGGPWEIILRIRSCDLGPWRYVSRGLAMVSIPFFRGVVNLLPVSEVIDIRTDI